jgi:hypothetical protein
MRHEATLRSRGLLRASIVTGIVLTLGACGAPVLTAGSTVPTTPSSAAAPTLVSPPSSSAVPTQVSAPKSSATTQTVVVIGYVQQIQPTGDFVLDDGRVRYTVVMSPTTSVVNERGRAASRLFIRTSGALTVTGELVGSTINAQSVLVPTRKENPDG